MRIMIADSHPEVRAALRLLLEEDSATWIVVAEAASAIELINRARSANPQVILVDWDLPGMQTAPLGADHQRADKIILALKAIAPKAKIMALSTSAEVKLAALQTGVDAFLCKSEPPQQLIVAIKKLEQSLAEPATPWKNLPNIPIEPSH